MLRSIPLRFKYLDKEKKRGVGVRIRLSEQGNLKNKRLLWRVRACLIKIISMLVMRRKRR